MTDVVNMRRESIDLEALLLSRTYLYTLFHKLFGGTPDAAVVACVLSETTHPSRISITRRLNIRTRSRSWVTISTVVPRRLISLSSSTIS